MPGALRWAPGIYPGDEPCHRALDQTRLCSRASSNQLATPSKVEKREQQGAQDCNHVGRRGCRTGAHRVSSEPEWTATRGRRAGLQQLLLHLPWRAPGLERTDVRLEALAA